MNDERKRVSELGLFFHCDISRPFQVISYGGHSHSIAFKDDHSSFCFVFFMSDRTKVLCKFMSFYILAKKETGQSMTKLQTDNGHEFLVEEFEDYIHHKGIRHKLTTP